MLKRVFLAGLIVGISGLMSPMFAEEALKKEEKSELAKLMAEIDKSYKAVEQISGYYKYSSNDWNVVAESSTKIIELTKIVIGKFSRPDDRKYQDLNKLMLTEAEKMLDVTTRKDEKGALEDAQWQVRRLRQTCAVCHKHLGIHIYPNLYPGKKEETLSGHEEIPAPKEANIPKDW